jgi:guanine deaminase
MKSSKRAIAVFDSLPSIAGVHRRDFLIASTTLLGATAGLTFAPTSEALAASGPVTDRDREFMGQAIKLMRQAGVTDKTGGPFGAVVVRDGQVLAASGNSVLRDNDPSAHAEVNAIRMACKKIASPNLKGATLYTSCEPCPMCYATAYWARVNKIYFAASWTDYADLFDDQNISVDMKRPYSERTVSVAQLMRSDAQKVWLEYRAMPEKTRY